MARRFTRGIQRGARRETSWIGIAPSSTTLASASSAALIASLNTAGLAKRPFTIVRTHIGVHVISDQLGADEFSIVGLGMCVVSQQAEGIGITAVPTPMAEIGSDLFYLHQVMFNDFTFVSGAGFDSQGGRDYMIDSKVARKVNDDEQVIIVAENSAITAAGCTILLAGRFLVKEV